MRCPSLRHDPQLRSPNSFRATMADRGLVDIEALVRMTEASATVRVSLRLRNPRQCLSGANVRAITRIDSDRFAVESGLFYADDGKAIDVLPRTGLLLTEVPETAPWVVRFERGFE